MTKGNRNMGKNRTYRIAVIPGDGIGKEVVVEGMRVIEAAGRRFQFLADWTEFPWGCDYFIRSGEMMPKDGLDRLRPFDALFLGAVGTSGVPDRVFLWCLLIPILTVAIDVRKTSPLGIIQVVAIH
ncbi:MAG TPA: isocitrate/isopropylmalate family dehydrogenase, partial [Syntrophales bacterium]|nr:isocitrate/isopropylmalate family dehydrogenase [Syntrophales bacterium]